MKIYVMRHGTTVWNERQITQGRSQNRLSKTGKELVEKSALEYRNLTFDVIYSSPLMRTMQTSNIMNKFHNCKISKDDRLIEIDQGIFTGRRKNSLTEAETKLKLERSKKYGMESYQEVHKRLVYFVNELKQNKKYQNVLIVTHNVCASMLAEILQGIEIDYSNDEHMKSFDNAQVKCFEI